MRTYKEHYRKCIQNYGGDLNKNLYNVTLEKNCIKIEKDLLNAISVDVANHLKNKHDITDTKWATYVNDFNSISGLEQLCSTVINNLEENYFNSYVKIENLHILQNKIKSPLESSWVWHYDDCPQEFLKFAIYLTDVEERSGPMSFVRGANNIVPVIETYRDHPGAIKGYPPPVFHKSRVPKNFVDSIVNAGGSVEMITGEMGTNFLFTPNIIHKGNNPCHKTIQSKITKPRMAIFMFIRPSMKKITNLVAAAKPKKANVNVKKYNLD